jgi:fibronectin-binding autotransporter adhesin
MIIRGMLKAKTIAAISAAAGLAIGASVALPGSASAGTCTNSLGLLAANTTCTATGTITLAGGSLTMGGPSNLVWSGSVTGAVQTIYDTSSSNDQTLYSSDLRGLPTSNAGSGWNITAVGSAFTGTATSGNATLPTSGVLTFGGGGNATLAAQQPTAACIIVLTCNVPTPSATPVTYPASVPTGGTTPTPTKIYQAAAGSGQGGVQIGGGSAANPATWAVTLPALVAADTYTSTVTLTIAAGP